mmetsp:Transcript_8071/g.23132  ORF Transcript_8071/g.23132 Transcript_8071/m.23132 type:complete len:443 (+) Transcript_8071:168-1496(+)
MAKHRRKKRTHQVQEVDPAKKQDPKSFVFRRGRNSMILFDLERDLRKVMMPHTALNLKESKTNSLKDFVNVAGPLGVSHFLILTASENASYLRIAKSPRGPTLTMRIHNYSLMRDVLGAKQHPHCPPDMFHHPPLVVMNNFGQAEEMKLASTMFQHLFPPINVTKVKLKTCQRVVLLDHDSETGQISFRHFHISAQPSGVSKGIRNLVQRKAIPDMSNLADVSEFVAKSGYGSESEGEDAAESRVTMAQDMGKGNLASRQSRVKLHEVGPRMELEVIKVEEGLGDGKVIFHKYVQKTRAEVEELGRAKREKEKLKEQRRREQEENVKRKNELEEAKAAAKAAKSGKKPPAPKTKAWWEQETEDAKEARREREADDDVEYYREEVGEEPDDNFKRDSAAKLASRKRKQPTEPSGKVKEAAAKATAPSKKQKPQGNQKGKKAKR